MQTEAPSVAITPAETVKQHRYPGPDSFRDDVVDSSLFFGRDAEVTEVLNRLLSNKLLVLYAKSGLGKTSLLQAGLFPKLRERDFLPIRLRFNHRGTGLLQELQLAVVKACKEQAVAVSAGTGDSYWEYFNSALFSKGDRFLTPILILDQFEEIFTLQNEAYRLQLGEQLGCLVSGEMPAVLRQRIRAGAPRPAAASPDVRLLISLREDSVGALQELVAFMPGILSQRFRLTPLDRERAHAAIVNPAQISELSQAAGHELSFLAQPFSYQPDTIKALLDYLQDKRGNIEPFQLQLLCRHIELKVIQQQAQTNVFTSPLEKGGLRGELNNYAQATAPVAVDVQGYLGGQAGMATVIKRFYQHAVDKLSGWRIRRKARALCETGLLNPEGISESLFLGKDFSGLPAQKSPKTTRPLDCYASPSRPVPVSFRPNKGI